MPSGIYERTKTHCENISKAKKGKIPPCTFTRNFNGENNPMYGVHRFGKDNPNYKCGRVKINGYILCYKPNHPFCCNGKYVYEHRLIAEKHLSRFLSKNEIVHHINENRSDNRPENLFVFQSMSEHIKFHSNLKFNPFLKTWLISNIV